VRIAVFGQAPFGRDVLVGLLDAGHDIVAVHVPPADRPDPLAEEAASRNLPLHRHRRYRLGGAAIPELVDEYRAAGAELNVMPFTTVILPPEIVTAPRLGSLCFHPSLLPRYRGGAALAWQIMLGERETGVTVFRPDAGVDTGPIVVQRAGVPIEPADTAGSLYFRKLYPLGIEAMLEAVEKVASGRARLVPQDESRASFHGLVSDEVARLDWGRSAAELDRWIRGCDPQPGAHARWRGERVRLFDAMLASRVPGAAAGTVLALADGRLLVAARGGGLSVGRLRIGDGPKQAAAEAGIAPGERFG
jgi:methionyl-tRNA formyltransferase